MLVPAIHSIDEIKKFVPSRLTIGLEVDNGVEELLTYPVGQSALHGFSKPVRAFAEGELDVSLLPRVFGERGDDIPIGVIQRSPKGVNSIARDNGSAAYDGFVLFGERGALASLCVCFKDIGEEAIFAEQLVKLRDVFRSSINL